MQESPVRVLHIVGARPNFVKSAAVMRAMAAQPSLFVQRLLHTGQHYDETMSDVFFDELGMATPDENLGVGSGSATTQIAQIMLRLEPLLTVFAPHWVVVVGDVNSTLAAALVAAKAGVKLAHVEAGLRSFDRSMPEEVNRVVVDALADLLLTPSSDADDNLRREGIAPARIRRVGNVMIDTLVANLDRARERRVPDRLGLTSGEYVYVTLHRPSNVDDPSSLERIVGRLVEIARRRPIVFPVHPRTRERLSLLGLLERLNRVPGIVLLEPVSYLDSICLAKSALCVVTDSGGLQEETTFLRVPCITLRPNTERPITISEGSNRLSTIERVVESLDDAISRRADAAHFPCPPLWDGRASERVAEALLSIR